MASQIPYDHQIWELTPTELKIAYLSLTMSKKDIAAHMVTKESTVGTHLTNIFTKLGITGVLDEEKRPLLKEKFGEIIEALVVDVGGDYEVEYRDRRKEALEERKQAQPQKQPRVTQPEMGETPPEPIIRLPFTRAVLNRRDLIMIAIGFTAAVFLLGLMFGGNGPPAADTGDPTSVFTDTATPSQPAPTQPLPTRTPTSNVSPTPENTSTPTNTPTPEITPTAMPFPEREDFNTEPNSLWLETGDPIYTTGTHYGFDGVFTARPDTAASLSIGNTAWRDYIIYLKADFTTVYGPKLEISFRVEDTNNRIVLSCVSELCSWSVIDEGITDILQDRQTLAPRLGLTLSVRGNTFTARTEAGGVQDIKSTQLILPSKYEDEFQGGGVIVEIINMEVDYIEIQEFR